MKLEIWNEEGGIGNEAVKTGNVERGLGTRIED